MSEILLGQSYYLRFDPKLWEAMQPYPPLGALYAASYLRSQGYSVTLFDAMLAKSEVEWVEALEKSKPLFAVLYEDNFNYLSKMCLLRMRQAAFEMISMARQKGCTVIVGGADASDHAAEYLHAGADYALLGEGELSLGELLDSLSGRCDRPLDSIQGIAFLLGGEIRLTARRPDIHDLDALPFPAWDLVDIPRYRETWLKRHGYFSMNMVTTRGCPFHCNWCAKPIWGQRYHTRSPDNVAAELKWLKDTYHPDHIWFADDIFGLKPGWVPRFANLLKAQGAQVPFKCLNRADLLLREGEVEALKQAGCQIVWMGAESGSQKILDAMDKGTTVQQIYDAARCLKQAGIQVGFFLQFGYPGEGLADIQKTFQMVRDCQPDDIGMSVAYPLPGTKFYAAVREQFGERQNWIASDDLAMLYRGPFSTAFYRQLHTTLHREFRAHKAWERVHSQLAGRKGGSTQHAQQPVSMFRELLSLGYNAARLPAERWKLHRLESASHQGLGPQPMPPLAAALPTPQLLKDRPDE
ncbi:MAG TPA: radical SAM protein [Anaerolineales bacterium]